MNEVSELGCTHYKRKAKFIAPCCKEIYTCRFCHDENEDHAINRFAITEIICAFCANIQRVRTVCQYCGIRFGKYTCLICNLFDDEDKGQFHCTACGFCRIGSKLTYFHCDRCNMCFNTKLSHTCIENAAKNTCPICLEGDMHTSLQQLHVPKCGHLLHVQCFEQLKASGHKLCPICQTSMS